MIRNIKKINDKTIPKKVQIEFIEKQGIDLKKTAEINKKYQEQFSTIKKQLKDL